VDGDVIASDVPSLRAAATARADVLIGYTLNEMAAFPGVCIDDASQRAGEAIFGAPSRLWAQDTILHGKSAWTYRFDYAPTPRFGACHCIELPFLFGTFEAFGNAPMLDGMPAAQAQSISETMQKNWIRFIRSGKAEWPSYPHMEIIN
jgi:para-nitrobenzyl esterase